MNYVNHGKVDSMSMHALCLQINQIFLFFYTFFSYIQKLGEWASIKNCFFLVENCFFQENMVNLFIPCLGS